MSLSGRDKASWAGAALVDERIGHNLWGGCSGVVGDAVDFVAVGAGEVGGVVLAPPAWGWVSGNISVQPLLEALSGQGVDLAAVTGVEGQVVQARSGSLVLTGQHGR